MSANQIAVVGLTPQEFSAPVRGREQPITRRDEEADSQPFDLRVVDPIRDVNWDAHLATHPQASVFHTRPRVLRQLDQASTSSPRTWKTAVLLPIMEVASPLTGRRGVSLPFIDFCGPLFFDAFEMKSIATILSTLARERTWKYLEVRGGPGCHVGQAPGPTFYGHTLPLDEDTAKLRAGFTGAVRRNLIKAERSGLTVLISRAREAVSRFTHYMSAPAGGTAFPQPFRF